MMPRRLRMSGWSLRSIASMRPASATRGAATRCVRRNSSISPAVSTSLRKLT